MIIRIINIQLYTRLHGLHNLPVLTADPPAALRHNGKQVKLPDSDTISCRTQY